MDPKDTFDLFVSSGLKALMWILEGKMAHDPSTFISFPEFSGFDQHLLHARRSLVVTLSLLLKTALWGKDVISPSYRWGNWRPGRLTFIISPDLYVTAGPKMKAGFVWPKFSALHNLACPGIIMGNHWLQWKTSMPLVIRGNLRYCPPTKGSEDLI